MTQATGKKKILIVKIGAIGDVVMALPLLREIEQVYPHAEISWLGGEIVHPLLKLFPRIDHLYTINESKLLKGSLVEKLFVVLTSWRTFFLKKYDLVLCLYRDSRYLLLTKTSFAKETRSFDGSKADFKIVPGRYHAAEYIRLLRNKNDFSMLAPFYPQPSLALPDELFKILSKEKKNILLTPGGAANLINGGDTRRWPIEFYAELSKKFVENGYQVILLGGENDKWTEKYFDSNRIQSLLGETNLHDVLALYNKSDLLVTHDTGLMHLAKLTSLPTIALFGPVNYKERIGNGSNIVPMVKTDGLVCAPCYDGKSFPECSNNLCMKNITVDEVFALSFSILNKSKSE